MRCRSISFLFFADVFLLLYWIFSVHLRIWCDASQDSSPQVPQNPRFWLLHPNTETWLIGKDPDSGKDWGHKEKRATEDEMVGWHHRLNGHEFEQALGVSERQGSLAWTTATEIHRDTLSNQPFGREEAFSVLTEIAQSMDTCHCRQSPKHIICISI